MVLLRFGPILLASALGGIAVDASAQNYPSRVVRMMVAFSAGSGTDTVGRIIAGGLTEVFGQQVIVDNRAGASGNIGAELIAKAAPDGYHLFLANITYAANASLYRNLSYDLQRDFAPVTQFATGPYIVVIHPSLPSKSIGDFVKLTKAKPGAVIYSSGGSGTATFLAAELFKAQAGVNMMHIPYKAGAEALSAVLSGEVATHFAPIATALPQVKHGRLRALAVTSAQRLALAPEYATIAESGYPGYEFGNWYGLMVPAKTPREAIATLHSATLKTLNNPTVSRRLTDLGYIAVGDQPEEFGAYIKSQTEKLAKIIKSLNLTAD